MITKIYVQERGPDIFMFPTLEHSFVKELKSKVLISTPLLEKNLTAAILNQGKQFDLMIETCIEAPPDAVIICPEIALHIDIQEKLIHRINDAIGDKPLQIFTQSATIFFPHYKHLIERI